MADKKVSDLPSLNGADVDPADLLYIVDSSAGAAGSKKITVGQYQLAPVSGGTANTVVYLNGSKVESSSSALTFDGTNFATTGTSSAAKLIPTGGTATGNGMYLPAANTLAWSNNGAETMRLDSSGNLGIGTSSPDTKLTVTVADTATSTRFKAATGIVRFRPYVDATSGALIDSTNAAESAYLPLTLTGSTLRLFGNSGTGATIDSSGNLSVGTATAVEKLTVWAGNAYVLRNGGAKLRLADQNNEVSVESLPVGSGSEMVFKSNTVERMRIDNNGNVGIGTSSPLAKLHVNGDIRSDGDIDLIGGAGTPELRLYQNSGNWAIQNSAGNLLFYDMDAAATRVTVDSSGNLGLGVTPSAWGSGIKSQQIGNYTALTNNQGGYTWLSNNAFFDTAWKYLTTNCALYYAQDTGDGGHKWFTAPSGTAGNAISFTQAMTLDASGNLLVGITSALQSSSGRGNITLNGSSDAIIAFGNAGVSAGYVFAASDRLEFDAASTRFIQFNTNGSERARITSGGNLLVGTTSTLTAFSGAAVTAAGITGMVAQSSVVGNEAGAFWNTSTAGDNLFVIFGTEATYTGRGSITYNRAGGLVAYNTTSDYRAKDIIGPVQNPGATIDALKVYEGVMKGATQSRPMLIAHEAQQHAPYAVSGVKDEVNEDGTPKFQQMDVSSLVPLLLAEIQRLRARVAALEAK